MPREAIADPRQEILRTAARLFQQQGYDATSMNDVAAALRDDSDGSRWHTAQLALAPLAPGDYAIEMAARDRRTITAFRVIQ